MIQGLQAAFNQDNGTWRIDYIQTKGFAGAGAIFGAWLGQLPRELTPHRLDMPGEPELGGSDHMSFICQGRPVSDSSRTTPSTGSTPGTPTATPTTRSSSTTSRTTRRSRRCWPTLPPRIRSGYRATSASCRWAPTGRRQAGRAAGRRGGVQGWCGRRREPYGSVVGLDSVKGERELYDTTAGTVPYLVSGNSVSCRSRSSCWEPRCSTIRTVPAHHVPIPAAHETVQFPTTPPPRSTATSPAGTARSRGHSASCGRAGSRARRRRHAADASTAAPCSIPSGTTSCETSEM